jgi:hypothetical protein
MLKIVAVCLILACLLGFGAILIHQPIEKDAEFSITKTTCYPAIYSAIGGNVVEVESAYCVKEESK